MAHPETNSSSAFSDPVPAKPLTIKWAEKPSQGPYQFTYGTSPSGQRARLHWHGVSHFEDRYAVLEAYSKGGWQELKRVYFHQDDPHLKTQEQAFEHLKNAAEELVRELGQPA